MTVDRAVCTVWSAAGSRAGGRHQGRPYTLALAETDELFTADATAHVEAAADLAWLTTAHDTI